MSYNQVDNVEIDDGNGYLYWFRRLRCHPRSSLASAAGAFRDAIARDLGLQEPYPEIIWFEPVDKCEASEQWNAAAREHPVGLAIDDNPLTAPVDIFRFWEVEPRVIHGGYTHKNGPRVIGILAAEATDRVLEHIAHECVHVHQDDREGPGWRMDNLFDAEAEASAYQRQARSRFTQQFEDVRHLVEDLAD